MSKSIKSASAILQLVQVNFQIYIYIYNFKKKNIYITLQMI